LLINPNITTYDFSTGEEEEREINNCREKRESDKWWISFSGRENKSNLNKIGV